MDNPEITVLSLCSGYAGIDLGLRRVFPNLRVIACSEIEEYACAVLAQRMEEGRLDAAPIWSDLRTFPGTAFHGKVDIIHAGVPCQPWSVAGKREGTKDERWIWSDIFRIIVEVRPEYVFLEEVPGFVSGGGFGFVLSDLAQAGFDAEWCCFTAAEVGAPHKRERLFVLAHRTDVRCLRHPAEPGSIGESQVERGLLQSSRSSASVPNTPRRGCGELRGAQQPGRGGLAAGGGDLADAEGKRNTDWEKCTGGAITDQCSSELADAGCGELSGRQSQPGDDGPQLAPFAGSRDLWPAGPGQPQYEWEEPRTVGYTPRDHERRDSMPGTYGQGEQVGGPSGDTIRERPVDDTGMRGCVNGRGDTPQ